MASRIDQYRAFAATCSATDYASKPSVRQHNTAANRMRAMVAELYAAGPQALAELLPLLEEPPSNQWLAFQLLELGKPDAVVAARCLSIIRLLASGQGSADAMGAGMWLRDWEAKHAEPAAPREPGGK